VRTPDIGLQTWDAMDKIKDALEEVGSSLENLLGLLQFVRADNNLGDGQRVVEARVEYFRKHAPSLVENPPTTTMVSVPSLYYSDMKVEILAWACIPNKRYKTRKKR
jgi:enamine deaminase RidA (YjgF/YER057c/UK114 family)